MPCLHEVCEFSALEVIEFYALVTVHITVHRSRTARGVGRNVNVALASVKVILDAHRVVGDEGLGELGIVVEGENGAGLTSRTIGENAIGKRHRRCCPHAEQKTPLIIRQNRMAFTRARHIEINCLDKFPFIIPLIYLCVSEDIGICKHSVVHHCREQTA